MVYSGRAIGGCGDGRDVRHVIWTMDVVRTEAHCKGGDIVQNTSFVFI